MSVIGGRMRSLQELLEHALKLDIRDRAELAEQLLASLDHLTEDESDRLWAEEAKRRWEEYRSGRARGTPASEVHREAEKLLR
jgi:putative addiction module component (TIGR02574 family)